MKYLIMGLPGSGKTTLAKKLAVRFGAIHLNADDMRNRVWTDLDFSISCRMIQSQRMGALSDILFEQGFSVIADFVCPTKTTRELFGKAKVIWMDTIKESRYEDTNQLFEPPTEYFLRITNFDYDVNSI